MKNDYDDYDDCDDSSIDKKIKDQRIKIEELEKEKNTYEIINRQLSRVLEMQKTDIVKLEKELKAVRSLALLYLKSKIEVEEV